MMKSEEFYHAVKLKRYPGKLKSTRYEFWWVEVVCLLYNIHSTTFNITNFTINNIIKWT